VRVAGVAAATQVAAGSNFVLALLRDRTVEAGGFSNGYNLGQEAAGSYGRGPNPTPIRVDAVSGAVQVSAGSGHALALLADGTIAAWGLNQYGQLGNGVPGDSAAPVRVSGISNATQVAAGYEHSLALLADGTVEAWGENDSGELGDGTTTNHGTPVPVRGLSGVVAIAAAGSDSYAMSADGTVWAWGANAAGQLGDGTTSARTSPVAVASLGGAVAIGAGDSFAMAVAGPRLVATPGALGFGAQQLRSSTAQSVTLTNTGSVAGSVSAISLAGPDTDSFAISADGCSGRTLAPGAGCSISVRFSPLRVGLASVSLAISGSGASGLTIAISGRGAPVPGDVYGWGSNYWLNLAYGGPDSPMPLRVGGIVGATQVSAGPTHALALLADGTVESWGWNDCGQLGNGATTASAVPARVAGVSSAIQVAAGPSETRARDTSGEGCGFSLALLADGTIDAWGGNLFGELGNGHLGPYSALPARVVGITGATQIAVGGSFIGCPARCPFEPAPGFALALLSNGTVEGWGANSWDNLGEEVGHGGPSPTPLQVTGVSDATQVAAGYNFSLALRANGSVLAWGAVGQSGELEFSDPNSPFTRGRPVVAIGVSGARQIAAGDDYALALRSDGTVLQWGTPEAGYSAVPAPVVGLHDIVAIAAGDSTAYALQSDGTVWAWGDNSFGELGDGTLDLHQAPVRVGGLGANAVAIASGDISGTAFAIVPPGAHVGHSRRPRAARLSCHRSRRHATTCTVALPRGLTGARVQLVVLPPHRGRLQVIATAPIRDGRAHLTLRRLAAGPYLVTIVVIDRRHRRHLAGHAPLSL
jgi:alpha-tubulin suppressor-like RCC1 family protein